MLTSLRSHEKNREVCINARSSTASLPFKRQATEQTTVKWPKGLLSWWLRGGGGGEAIGTSIYTQAKLFFL